MRMQKVDIVIVGGGLVGTTFARLLADLPLSLVLIDDQAAERREHDLRAYALNKASEKILRAINAWPSQQENQVHPFCSMFVWDSGGAGSIQFDAHSIGEVNLGHIVNQPLVMSCLELGAAAQENLRLIRPDTIKSITRAQNIIILELASGVRLSTSLVVGADGTHSTIRTWAGINTTSWSYAQTAIVATVETERDTQHTAWQRFLPTGPLAFLPLSEKRCSIVWSADTAVAQELLDVDTERFEKRLTEAFEHRLGKVRLLSERAAFPLSVLYANSYVASGLALIGDAAHRVHPLGGQGVNLGLMDATCLADLIRNAPDSISSWRLLRTYERSRKSENLVMTYLLDGFKRLFGNTAPPLVGLRGFGLNFANQCGGFKRWATRHACGLASDLPSFEKASDNE